MILDEIEMESLSNILPAVLIKYLTFRDWILIEQPKALNIAILRKTFDNLEEEILVPKDRNFADYARRVLDVIKTIASHENRNTNEVVSDLFVSDSDVLRIRITGVNIERGTIPFLDAKAAMEGFKKVLIASACYVLDPQPFYPKLQKSEAEQMLRSCRLDAFEPGSFVIKIQFPLKDFKYSKNSEKPFSRRVTECLMISLNKLVSYIDKQHDEISSDSKKIAQLNANLCLGLSEMKFSEQKTNFDFRMSWCCELPVSKDIPEKVTIYDDYVSAITELGQALKPQKEATQNVFIGKVIGLNGVENEKGEMQGLNSFLENYLNLSNTIQYE